ncbi:hypothetical protein F2Q70_00003758 [Brassica cretica]|uniref:Uncharacterized protein n=1 Tax=Brassica cretica TaxID=69181 RepID=A0A8S9IUJ6_BRACR|nr:hypothetical protein F2Q70_00003758 [Brassica cretica]
MLITTIRLNLIEFGRDEVEAMIDPLLHAQRKEKEEGKGLEKNACVFRIPYGVRVQVSFGRYSQDGAECMEMPHIWLEHRRGHGGVLRSWSRNRTSSPTRRTGKLDRAHRPTRPFSELHRAHRLTRPFGELDRAHRPTRQFGKLDRAHHPNRPFGELDRTHRPTRLLGELDQLFPTRLGLDLVPFAEPRRINPSFRIDRSYHWSFTIRMAKTRFPE